MDKNTIHDIDNAIHKVQEKVFGKIIDWECMGGPSMMLFKSQEEAEEYFRKYPSELENLKRGYSKWGTHW